MTDTPTQRSKYPSITTMIVTSVVAGVLCGLFFGEYTTAIKWVGDAFVGLLQMAVLPYVAASLVTNVGRLSVGASFRLLRTAVVVLLALWGVGIVTLVSPARIWLAGSPIWRKNQWGIRTSTSPTVSFT